MKCHLAGLTGPYEGRYMAEHHGTGTGKFTTWEGGHRVPTLAYWPSRIAPGGVTGALTSTLDIFPTFAALAGATLPTNRSFDGLDLTSLLLQDSQERSNDNTTEGHETLFHPDQFGQLSAMRLDKYKVHFRLTQAPPCVPGDKRNMDDILEQWPFVLGDGDETKGWLDVPLVFDLEADPHEAYPLTVSQEDADMLHDLWQHKMDDIQNDFHSTPDYSQCDDPTGWPCCNVESPACFCPSAGQKMMI
jgi:arylsulfatase G